LFALIPVVLLFAQGLLFGGLGGWISALTESSLNQQAFENSLEQGGISAVLAVAIGYPAGVFLGRYTWPGRSAVRAFLLVPFLLPSIVVVLGMLDLFGPSGALSSAVPALGVLGHGIPAIIAANLLFNVPIVILFTALGCESAPAELEETAVTLGAGPGRTYRDVWGPPSWLGAAAGGFLTFLFSAVAFATPLVLCGARCYTVEARIWYLDQYGFDPTGASLLALALFLFLVIPTVAYLALLHRLRSRSSSGRARSRILRVRTPVAYALAAETLALLGAIVVFLATVLYRSLTPAAGGTFGSPWSELFSPTATNLLGIPMLQVVGNTLFFAAVAATIVLLLGVVAGYALGARPRLSTGLSLYLFLPLLISPVLLAFSLAQFWRPVLGGESTVWILIIVSQSILALPFALQSLQIPLAGLSPSARDSARVLGAPSWIAYLDTDLPRVRPGLMTAGLFAFALGLGEFTATYFLVTPNFTTLSVAVYDLQGLRQFPLAEAAAGLLLVVSLAVFAAVHYGGRHAEF
jgi:thiamine transport system permease protein